jgi:type IV secretion system protein VirB6
MASQVVVFMNLEKQMREPVLTFVREATTSLASTLAGPLRSCLMIMVLWHAYKMLRGESQEPIQELINKLVKGAVVVTLVTNTADYQTYVTNLFLTDLPKTFSEGLGFGDVTAGHFDAILQGAQGYVNRMYAAAGYTEMIKAAIAAGVVYVVIGIMTAQGYFMFLYSTFATALLLGVGPIFVSCLLFDQTRKYFEGWISQLVNYVVLNLLGLAVLRFMLTAFKTLFDPAGKVDLETGMVGVITTGFFCFGILKALPTISQGIAGGAWFDSPKANPASALGAAASKAHAALGGRSSSGPAGPSKSAARGPSPSSIQQQQLQQGKRD